MKKQLVPSLMLPGLLVAFLPGITAQDMEVGKTNKPEEAFVLENGEINHCREVN